MGHANNPSTLAGRGRFPASARAFAAPTALAGAVLMTALLIALSITDRAWAQNGDDTASARTIAEVQVIGDEPTGSGLTGRYLPTDLVTIDTTTADSGSSVTFTMTSTSGDATTPPGDSPRDGFRISMATRDRTPLTIGAATAAGPLSSDGQLSLTMGRLDAFGTFEATCADSAGAVEVLEFELDPEGQVARFAADVQFGCLERPGLWTLAALRFNSTAALDSDQINDRTITGTIVDHIGQPVAGVSVCMNSVGRSSCPQSNADGAWLVELPPLAAITQPEIYLTMFPGAETNWQTGCFPQAGDCSRARLYVGGTVMVNAGVGIELNLGCVWSEATIVGTPDAETITGTDGDDVIVGLGGGDTILGLGGDDIICAGNGLSTVFAGDGDDVLIGGIDPDNLRGQNGNDLVWGNAGDDVLRGNAGNDVLRGDVGDDDMNGGRDNDSMVGGSGDDFMRGSTGDDTMNGGSGNDGVNGNGGSDIVIGDDGDDRVTGGPRPDRIWGDCPDNSLTCVGNDELRGFGGADEIWGGRGDDMLFGGKQQDQLIGGTGIDMCSGGTTGITESGGATPAAENDLALACESEISIEGALSEPPPGLDSAATAASLMMVLVGEGEDR